MNTSYKEHYLKRKYKTIEDIQKRCKELADLYRKDSKKEPSFADIISEPLT